MSAELRDINNTKTVVDQLKALSTIYEFHADYIQDLTKHLRKLCADGRLTKEEYSIYTDALGTAQHNLYQSAIALSYIFADE